MASRATSKAASPRPLRSKIKSRQALKRSLASARKGKKVVFTNGCFDLLHKGHVTYLQEARKLGHLLVVALNTDESVQKLKGPTRPLNHLEARLAVVAALESVDFVTWFGEDDPRKLILELKPDVLVKGGDYKPDQILGSREVFSWGGRVKSLSFVKGESTSSLIEKASR